MAVSLGASAIAIPSGGLIRSLAPGSTITPLELDGWWGLNEDPAEQATEVYLHVVDKDNLMDASGFRTLSTWTTAQNYEKQGTLGQVDQTYQRETVEFFNAIGTQYRYGEAPVNKYLAIIVNNTTGATPSYVFNFQVTYMEVQTQRIFPGSEPSNWEEEMVDVY